MTRTFMPSYNPTPPLTVAHTLTMPSLSTIGFMDFTRPEYVLSEEYGITSTASPTLINGSSLSRIGNTTSMPADEITRHKGCAPSG